MQGQHLCRAVCKILLHNLYQNFEKEQNEISIDLNCDGNTVSEMGPWGPSH